MSYAAAASRGPQQSAEEVCILLYHMLEPRKDCIGEEAFHYIFPIYIMLQISRISHAISHTQVRERHQEIRLINSPQKRAPAPPSVEHTESTSTASLIDVDTDSVHTVPSDFTSHSIQTSTQADRLEREVEEAEAVAREEYARAKKSSKKGVSKLHANSDNPVVIVNALAVVGLSGALGFAGYRKYAGGELTWKLVGLWAGVIGLFGVGDYYLSQ